MVDQVSGRAADSGQALASDQAASRLGPTGFDPSRLFADDFANWVAEKPPEKPYKYTDNCHCAIAEYLTDRIGCRVLAGSATWCTFENNVSGKDHALPRGLDGLVQKTPHTFGALAERLQQAA